ncbi:MAG TPA: tetratricopeptide repeat protein [Steroidobacteraceae bacterium]|nr:tetratricopeptide repeat protein [Steroidobacteraceae bacterium]
MRNSLRSIAVTLLLATTCTAFGAGGGELPNRSSGSASRLSEPTETPEEKARNLYNAGVRLVQKADELNADAMHQADERKKTKVRAKAEQAYAMAMKKFATATELQPADFQAWNYLGYTHRKLGKYDTALAAYDRSLKLQPNYADAIEYRGHAYLGLNRLAEAKEAYLTLFAGNRKLAATLLAAMQEWVGERRGNAAGIDGATVESFATWVSERSTIASQTAALTREGAASAWQ